MSAKVYVGNLSWNDNYHSLSTIDHCNGLSVRETEIQDYYESSPIFDDDSIRGQQSFGNVHTGEWMGRVVAMKTLKQGMNDEEHKLVFRPWMNTHHLNVAPLLGVCNSGYNPSMNIIMPQFNNGNLNDFVAQNPNANRKALLIGIAQGLRHIHENDIIHGDLRGENILIDDSGNSVLSNFGISNALEQPEIGLGSSIASTLRWQAPECVMSTTGQDFSPQSDIWSFGCIAGELSTGQVPFASIPNAVGIVLAHHRRSPPFKFARGGKTHKGNDHYNRDIMHYISPFCTYYDRFNRPSVTVILAMLLGEEHTVKPENRYHRSRARL